MVESDLCNLRMTNLRFEIIEGFNFEILGPNISLCAQVAALLGEVVVVEHL